MKKLALSILTLLYLASTTGAMLETHFCMGKVADWSIGDSAGDRCGLCGMQKSEEQDNGCCSDEESFFKITDDQKAPGGISAPSLLTEARLTRTDYLVCIPMRSFTNRPPVHGPPGNPGPARHVLISVFRI